MTISLIARWVAKPQQGPKVAELVAKVAAKSSAEDGCLRYEVWSDGEEGQEFVLIETYRDETALESHRASIHFHELVLGTIVPLLAERSVKIFEAVTSTP